MNRVYRVMVELLNLQYTVLYMNTVLVHESILIHVLFKNVQVYVIVYLRISTLEILTLLLKTQNCCKKILVSFLASADQEQ